MDNLWLPTIKNNMEKKWPIANTATPSVLCSVNGGIGDVQQVNRQYFTLIVNTIITNVQVLTSDKTLSNLQTHILSRTIVNFVQNIPNGEKRPITKEHVKELSGQTNGVIWLIGTLINILFVLNSMICLSFFFTKKEIASMTQKGCGCHPQQFTNEQKQFIQFQQWDNDK